MDALIDSVQKLADDSAEVIVIGEPDHSYAVEYTEDFDAWTFLGEAASANGCVRFVDTSARGRPGRFYRLVKPQ